MRRPSRRISRLLGFTVVPVSLIATGLFVTASSYSVFNAQTTNPTNTWQAGSLTLTDDDGGNSPTTGAAMFTTPAMKPGDSGSRCIAVTYKGTVPTTVKLYGTTTGDAGLNGQMKLTVTQGTSSSFAATPSCNGFTALATGPSVFALNTFTNFVTANASYGTNANANTWTTAGDNTNEKRVYKFDWSFPTTGTVTGDNVFQGVGTNLTFVWEAQTS